MARVKKQTVTQQIMAQVRERHAGRAHDISRKQYVRDTKKYVKFCRESFDCKSFAECRAHLQDYADYLQSKNYAASTIHTYLAAACSSFDVNMGEIHKPIRHVADYKRGRSLKDNGTRSDLNDIKWKYLVDFQRVVGLRREELMDLMGKDLVQDESGRVCVRVRRGKGGKPQDQRINDGYEAFVESYFKRVASDEHIFKREIFDNDLNLHSLRAESARKYYYEQLKKIEGNPAYKQRLISEIYARCRAHNHDKNGKTRRIPKNEMEGYYVLRGKNRQLAKDKGLPLSYNKVALLATSIFKLSHWRNDVTVASYILA